MSSEDIGGEPQQLVVDRVLGETKFISDGTVAFSMVAGGRKYEVVMTRDIAEQLADRVGHAIRVHESFRGKQK